MKSIRILFTSLFCIIISYYVSTLLHEYGHATTAWLLGYKHSPFDISYGSWYLLPVSEHVNYQRIFQSGQGIAGALIGISGISVTIILFLLSIWMLNIPKIKKIPFVLLFFFWLANINLMEIYLYIVNRCFSSGDISEFSQGFGISPFWLFIPGSLLAILAVYRFYWYELPKIYRLTLPTIVWVKRVILYMTFWPALLLIIYWSPPENYVLLTYGMAIFSVCFLAVIFIKCDPKRQN